MGKAPVHREGWKVGLVLVEVVKLDNLENDLLRKEASKLGLLRLEMVGPGTVSLNSTS